MKELILLLAVGLSATAQASNLAMNLEADCPPTGILFLPYPDDCKFYIICNNGVPILRQCATGLIFDLLTNNCNFPADSICIKDATPPTATTDGGEPTDPIDPEDPDGPTAPTPTQTVPTAPTPPGEDTTVPTAPTPAFQKMALY